MKKLLLFFAVLLMASCVEPVLYTSYASVFVTNTTETKTNATVDGKTKTIFAVDYAVWDIEWEGLETKTVTISIPSDTVYVDLEDGDIKEYYIY